MLDEDFQEHAERISLKIENLLRTPHAFEHFISFMPEHSDYAPLI